MEGTVVRVSAQKATNPPRLNDFFIKIEIPSAFGDQHREGIEKAVQHCLIHNTLLNPPSISLEVKSSVLQAVCTVILILSGKSTRAYMRSLVIHATIARTVLAES